MNFYQQPFNGIPYAQPMFQQPMYPQFVYADQLPTQQESGTTNGFKKLLGFPKL